MKEFFKKSMRIAAKVFKWILIAFIILFVAVFAIWKVPSIHEYAVNKGTSYFNEKTGGQLSIGKVDLRLPFFIGLEDIDLLSPDGLKLATIDGLEIYPSWRMLFAKTIRIDEINLSGIEGKIFVNKNGEFNFDFITEGFNDSAATETVPADSASSGWELSIGDLNIESLDFIYADRTTGDSIDLKIESFELDMDVLDLENQAFKAESISLQNSSIYAAIPARAKESDSNTSSLLPEIGLEELEILNAHISMKLGTEPAYEFQLGQVFVETDEIDLNKNKFYVEELLLVDSQFNIPLPAQVASTDSITYSSTDQSTSFFVDIDLKVEEFELENISLRAFDQNDTLHSLKRLSISAEDISANSSGFTLDLKSLSGQYNEFDELQEFHGDFAFQNSAAKANNMQLRYGQSTIKLEAVIEYDDVAGFLDSLNIDFLAVSLDDTRIASSDVKKIYTILELDSLPIPAEDIFINLDIEGDRSTIDFTSLKVKTGSSFFFIEGSATALSDSLWQKDLTLRNLELSLKKSDLIPYISYIDVDTAMIPSFLTLELKGNYNSKNADAEGIIKSPFGNIAINLQGDGWSTKKQGLSVLLESNEVRVGDYLKLSEKLNSDFSLKLETQNLTDSSLHLCTELRIDTLHFAHNQFANLNLNADIIGKEVIYAFSVQDTFMYARIGGMVDFTSGIDAVVSGRVKGIDLQGLNYATKDIRGSFNLNAKFKTDSISAQASTEIEEILFVKEGERFPLDPLKASFYTGLDSTTAMIEGGFIQLHSVSNRRLDSLSSVIRDFLALGENESILDKEAYWKATFQTSDLEDIGLLFLLDLKEFKPSSAEMNFSASDNELVATAMFPGIKYGNFNLDSLLITTTDGGGSTKRKLSINTLAYDTLALKDLSLTMNQNEDGTQTLLTINPDTSKNYYQIGANLKPDSLKLSNGFTFELNDTLILDGNQWFYEKDCFMKSDKNGISFQDFRIYSDQKVFQLEKEESDSPLIITVENFPLRALTGIINTEEKLFQGIINGRVLFNRNNSFEGDGNITNFKISGADFGTLEWEASNENGDFETYISAKGEFIDIVVDGNILPQNDSLSTFDLDVKIKQFDLHLLEELVSNNIAEASGSVSGGIAIDGTTTFPKLSGALQFKNASIRPDGARSGYMVNDEKVKIIPEGLAFEKFTLTDENGSNLSIDGTIKHKKFAQPELDLKIRSENFTLVDILESANSPFYGKLVADLNLEITGPPTSPEVDAKVKINEPTDFTYIVTTKADIEAFDKSLLVWTNFGENPEDDIVTRNKQEKELEGNIFASNPQIKGELIIDKSAIFQVIVDSSAGDYLQIQGSGKLDIDYDRTGALRFNGVYEVDNGFYQMTFYDIQKKKFNFIQGSKLVWNGEPTNANIDISASYKTRAGISNLMLTDGSASYDDAFQQQLPFIVLLNVDGKLLEPQITFDIQLAQEAEGSLSGSVEARLNDLRENESQLNKQVFALLILGSFLPQDGGSDSNVLANQARNSASQILTNQLNNLSDKYVKGVDINFDMYSYGGSAGQGSTDLSVNLAKSFADDRIIVKVGSTMAIEEGNSGSAQSSQQQFMTNIELEYKLTPDGRYRLLVFSKTDLEDIVIGRITRSGGGFVFQKDFDRFRYIFNEPEKESTEIEEEDNTKK
ncbi:MAG: translocation and assembly module TamB [Cryomorphaceae bacterium]|jgi:translocation and assembly module TamB